ncbi:hypothetical protein SLEP1_g36395 [Rubroshorea leprosula]|uniref:Uncharacterized protein n=1 Tax=Rubroshorea leprosula TaxID=152421 RepID=A0AAV5KRH9_9ROSI|nr:hypothetical protein SLEP1_g36395 [Rubroshorea leprosula]
MDLTPFPNPSTCPTSLVKPNEIQAIMKDFDEPGFLGPTGFAPWWYKVYGHTREKVEL